MQELCEKARAANKFNVAFMGYFMLQDADACLDVLTACGRLPEAAFFARTYRPSRCSEMLSLWKADLRAVNGRAAEALADPAEYTNLFPDWEEALEVEAAWEAAAAGGAKPASAYPAYAEAGGRDLIALVRPLAPLRMCRCMRSWIPCRTRRAVDVWVRMDTIVILSTFSREVDM